MTYDIPGLTAALPKLTAGDATFATSLIGYFNRNGTLTERQAPHVAKLIAKAEAASAALDLPAVEIGNLTALLSLFDLAATRRKRKPEVTIDINANDPTAPSTLIVVARAGNKARLPGTLDVQTPGKFGENTWYGRILRDGTLDRGYRGAPLPAGLVEALRTFAADPLPMAVKHGIKTGRCCFCNLALDNPESKTLGYGPTCAKNYGLAHGKKAARAAKADDAEAILEAAR